MGVWVFGFGFFFSQGFIFCLFYVLLLGATASCAQGLLLVLYSRVTSGSAQWCVGDRTWVSYVPDKRPPALGYITLPPPPSYLLGCHCHLLFQRLIGPVNHQILSICLSISILLLLLFHFLFYLGGRAALICVQGLFLVLHSGITLGNFWGTMWNVGDHGSCSRQASYLLYCIPAPVSSFSLLSTRLCQ